MRLEIVNLGRDPPLSAALATFTVVFLLSAIASSMEVRDDARIKAEVASNERERWLGQGDIDPHTAAHYSIYAFKPSLPLQTIDPGIVPFVGEAVWLEAHHQNDLLFRPQQDARMFERLGLVDPSALLTRFGPLAVFLVAFAVTTRERGVLRLALGNTSHGGAYLGAKIAAVTTASVVALVVPLLVTGLVSVTAAVAHDSDEMLRLAGWTVSAVMYVAALSSIAVSASVAARSNQTACAALLLIWVSLVLAALPLASAIAKWNTPLPSFQQMKLVLIDEAPAYWTPEAGAEQIASILQRYGASSEGELAGLRVNVRGAQLDVAERHAQAVFDREIGGFYDRVVAQDASYARLAWLSPAVAFDVASAAWTGTDFVHHRHFIDFAESYRRRLVNRMNADLIPNPAVGGREHTSNIDLWSDVPAFDYTPLSASAAARSASAALVALAFWAIASVGLAALTARRIRI
jgi:ABC-2 type transport system permease protein